MISSFNGVVVRRVRHWQVINVCLWHRDRHQWIARLSKINIGSSYFQKDCLWHKIVSWPWPKAIRARSRSLAKSVKFLSGSVSFLKRRYSFILIYHKDDWKRNATNDFLFNNFRNFSDATTNGLRLAFFYYWNMRIIYLADGCP